MTVGWLAISQLFTSEDAEYVLNVVSQQRLAVEEVSVVVLSLEELESGQISLDEIAGTLHGVTDPIGQLASWLYDRLRDLASWFANAVRGAIEWFWNNAIQPMLVSMKNAIIEIGNFLRGVPGHVAGFVQQLVDGIKSGLAGLADWINANVITPIINAIRTVGDKLREFFDLVAKIPELVSGAAKNVWDWIQKNIIAPIANAINSLAKIVGNVFDTIRSFLFEQLPRQLAFFLETAKNVIVGGLKAVWGWIQQNIVRPLTEALQQLGKLILSGLDTLRRFFVEQLPQLVASIPKTIQDLLGKAWSWIQQNIIQPLTQALNNLMQSLSRFMGLLAEQLPRLISEIPARIRGALTSLWSTIQEKLIRPLTSALQNVAQTITTTITRALDSVRRLFTEQLPQMIAAIPDAIRRAAENAWNWIQQHIIQPLINAAQTLAQTISQAFNTVLDWINKAKTAIEDMVSGIWEKLKIAGMSVVDFIGKLVDWVRKGFENIGKALEGVVNSIKLAGQAITGFVNAILKFPEWFPKWFNEHIAKPIIDAIRGFAKWVWDNTPEWFKNFFEKLGDIVKGLYDSLQGFLKDPVGSIAKALMGVWEKLVEAGEWFVNKIVKPALSLLQKAGELIWSGVQWLLKSLAKILGDMVSGFATAVSDVASSVADALTGLLTTFVNIAKNVVSGITSVAWRLIPKEFAELKVEAEFMKHLSPLIALASPFTIPFAVYFNALKAVLGTKGNPIPEAFANPIGTMYAILNATTAALVGGLLAAKTFKGLSKILREVRIALGLQPPGPVAYIGTRITAHTRLSELLSEISESVEKLLPDIVRYIMIGNMIWWAEPTRVFTRYMLTEWVTIELPPLEHGLEALRRHLVTPLAPKYYEEFVAQLRMGGIGKPLIDAYYPLPEELAKLYASIQAKFDEKTRSIVITDRFGQPRLFPVSLVAAIPSPEKLASMMIRDIIQDPKDFAAAMGMHGFTPDTAFMFYLLHYRYPSPEKLAEFFWRGIAGELWNPDKSYDKQIVETFFKKGQAPTPVAPKELNFQAEKLFEIMKQYMKWHDYARFPWKSGWPTDNAIVIDLIADIPGKIDLRWMSRWGLFDYWGAYGITVTTSIEKITRDLLKPGEMTKAEPMYNMYVKYLSEKKPVFDVRQYARTLQATGLHPYWVPWVTIAETINALTEERTLLRTGFINLFREGIWSLEDLNKLLAGFFTVIFKTAYFDPSEMKWKEVDVEYPVAFLPAESKLLELRAVMDKALDIYREAYRRIIRAVAYNVVSPDDAKKLLSAIIESMNKSFFVNEIQRISGKQYELKLDEGYWKAWTTYASVIQELEARERTRFYARYIIWSVLWGLRWGYTTPEEAAEWLDKLVDMMHEHQIVKKAIRLSLDFMIGRSQKELAVRAVINLLRSRRISVEEAVEKLKGLGFDKETAKKYIDANVIWYTPSITTYASMLEVVPEALKTVLDAVQHFNLPEDEQQYWMIYIMRQPVRDELTLVRTRIYQLLSLGMEPEELTKLLSDYSFSYRYERGTLTTVAGPKARELLAIYEKAEKVFRAYGISPHEWVLYNLIARMEELKDKLKEAARERIPSPSTLAVLAEYLVLPEELVKQALEKYGVSKEWLPYWLKYIEVKPIKSDAKSLLSVYIRALRYGVVTEQQLRQYITELAKYGFTPKEIDLIKRRVELEEAIEEARELRRAYLPTPTMLATLSEVVEIPPELVKQALVRRRVPEEWHNLWLQYIARRPLYDDFRYMMNRYYRALRYGVKIPEDLQKKIQQYFDMFHVTDVERDLRNLAVTLDVLVEEARAYIPTPAQLATLAEYMVIPENLINMVFDARHVPPEWRPIWLNYIRLRPIKSDYKQLLTAYIIALRYGVVSEDEVKKFIETLTQKGFTKEEIDVIRKRVELEELIAAAREYLPTPMTLATLAEYLVLPEDLIKEVLARRRVPEKWIPIWLRYIRVRPLADDLRVLVSAYYAAKRYGVPLPRELEQKIQEIFKQFGLTEEELEIRGLAATIRALIDEYREAMREYIPTPSMLATIAEYVPVPKDLIDKVFEARHVPPEWRPIWLRYIQVRPLADDARYLLTRYLRAKARMVPIPKELEEQTLKILQMVGFTDVEKQIRDLAVKYDILIEEAREYVPTPAQLATLAEYVYVPDKLIDMVFKIRHVPPEWQPIWRQYIYVRMVSREVNTLVATFRRLYEYFTVSRETMEKIYELMTRAGWSPEELAIFKLDLQLRKQYRVLSWLIPTLRQFVADARYIPEWPRLLEDWFKARGLDARKYEKQIQYYKKLIRNRMVWRQIAWYRSTLVRAYAYGAITREQLYQKLQRLKDYGLSDEEIALIMDAAEAERARIELLRARRRR